MEIINETIKKVAEIKAKAAREAAEKIEINGIEFKEGVRSGEVEMNSGIEELSSLLGCELLEGFHSKFCCEGFVNVVRWFFLKDVRFFENSTRLVKDLPGGAIIFDSAEDLYVSV